MMNLWIENSIKRAAPGACNIIAGNAANYKVFQGKTSRFAHPGKGYCPSGVSFRGFSLASAPWSLGK